MPLSLRQLSARGRADVSTFASLYFSKLSTARMGVTFLGARDIDQANTRTLGVRIELTGPARRAAPRAEAR